MILAFRDLRALAFGWGAASLAIGPPGPHFRLGFSLEQTLWHPSMERMRIAKSRGAVRRVTEKGSHPVRN